PVAAYRLLPYTTLFRSYLEHSRRAVVAGIGDSAAANAIASDGLRSARAQTLYDGEPLAAAIADSKRGQSLHTTTVVGTAEPETEDRKSTRLNSSHVKIS